MNIEEIKQSFLDKVIRQYKGKPKAEASIKSFIDLVFQDCILDKVKEALNINTAVGKQLDAIGLIVGETREYQGSLQDPISLLNDEDYRFILKLRIINNSTNCSEYQIREALYNFFGFDIRMHTENNMTMLYILKATATEIAKIALDKKVFPKPAGVGLDFVISDVEPLFAFVENDLYDITSLNLGGFNEDSTDIAMLDANNIIQ